MSVDVSSTDDFPILGGFTDLDENDLLELHPKLVNSFVQLGEKHPNEFDLIVKRIISGKSQVVAGTRYMVNVQAENSKNETKNCEAEIWEKLWENFFQVKLKCQDKHFTIDTKLPECKLPKLKP